MLFHHILYFIFLIIYLTYCQSTIRIGIIDDHDNPKGIININLPNLTFCGEKRLNLQLYWINISTSIANLLIKLEFEQNSTNIYLIHANKFYTKLLQDFCRINHKLFINMQSYESKTMINPFPISLIQEYFIIPNILRVLINYLKSNHVQRAAYIYDNNESTQRIYELLKLMNNDEYFNNFSLDIRITRYEDIYSLLYNIEVNTLDEDQLSTYILLDLYSYEDYERMFETISHMGLTSDSYRYLILSTFNACLWMNTLNFTGQLIYFDYQQRECILDYQSSSNNHENSSLATNTKYDTSYYRSTLSFRNNPKASKPSDSSQISSANSSVSSNNTNSCYSNISINDEYFSYSYLSKISRFPSRPLFDSLNLIIRIVTSNLLDCKTYRLKKTKRTLIPPNIPDVNIFSIKKSLSNQIQNQVQLIGRYSTINNIYQSCQTNQHKDLSKTEILLPSRIYYITSLFDEPFLMLRKRSNLSEPNNFDEISGRIFHFHELEGYCVDLAEKVCSILNITCQFRIVQDGHFGSKNESTGIWDGMVGDIVSRKADMAIAPLTISQQRMEVVEFSKPFMNLGISIMIRKPDAQKPGVFSFMHPVSMEIWLCFSLSYFAVSFVIYFTSRIVNSGWHRRIVRRPSYRSFSYPKSVNDRRKSEIHFQRQKRDSNLSEQSSEITAPPRVSMRRRGHYRARPLAQRSSEFNKNKKEDKSKQNSVHLFGISNALFFSFASFMRQPINLVPKSFSGRVAATSWWYFSLIFISSYTANLVAFLTVEKLVAPIESVEDLAKHQEMIYGSLRNGTTSAFFEKSNVSVFQHMWMMMQKSSSELLVATNDEGVAKVRHSKGKYAFFIESTKNEYVNERLPCDTMKIGSDLDSKGYGIATRLGSDLTEAANIIITNLRESGFLDKLKQRWWYERSECSQITKDKRFSELSLSSVTGLFYIFLAGIIISCIIAFTEFLITAKTESETLDIDIREILRIKMIENMVGITINTQRQLEFGRVDSECNYQYNNEEDEMIKQYTEYQLQKTQSDV